MDEEHEFKMLLSDKEIADLRELMVKWNTPLWQSFIPKSLRNVVAKLEKAIKEHGKTDSV